MPTETKVSYEQVAEIAESMDARGANPSVDSIMAITGGRRDYVRIHLKTWRDRKRKEREALLASAIDERLAKIILEDREAFTKKETALLLKELEDLEDDCSSMERGIAALHSERDALIEKLTLERETNEKQSRERETSLAILQDSLERKEHQITELDSHLVATTKQAEAANKQIADLNRDLGHYTSEAAMEKTRADDLQKQLKETSDNLIQAKSELLASTKDVDHLRAEVSRLETQAELLQTKLDEQSNGRIEALQGAIKTLQAGKPQKGGARSATAKPTGSKAASTSAPT